MKTERDLERIQRDWMAWWAGELDRPLVMIETCEPGTAPVPGYITNLPLDMPAEQVIDLYQSRLEATHFHGDAFPRWWPNLGPGITAGFLGADVHPAPDTVWFSYPQPVELQDLHFAYDADNFWWKRVRELTQAAAARWGQSVAVGHTDLGGNLDILASFRTTQQLAIDLIDAPREVERVSGELTRLWLRYYDELDAIIRPACGGTAPWAPVWSPRRGYMLQSDFSYMISPRMFERFVLPDLITCCAALDDGFYHMDGKGQIPHLDRLLEIERLRGIQWSPGDGAPPPEKWLPLLKRIRDGGKLCQLFVTPQGARTIVQELGGRGFALSIDGNLTDAEADDLVHALTARP